MVKLGSVVRDVVTGFSGVAIGRTEWLFGCTRIGIEPQDLHEGKPRDAQWFDEQRVQTVTAGSADTWHAEPPASPATKPPGGPQRDPKRSADPRR